MKTLYKAVILSALGLGTMATAQAQTDGDALLGFNDYTGAGNDYVINLGSYSQFTTTATLNLSSDFSSGSFTTAFTANPDANVAAGFVGTSLNGNVLLQSYAGGTPSGALPSGTPSSGTYTASVSAEGDVLVGEYASATGEIVAGNAWSDVVAQSPTLGGYLGSGNVAGATGNPMGLLSSGQIVLAVYESTYANIGQRGTANITAWTQVGTLDVNTSTDSIIYTGSAVPEPASYGILGGAGLLIAAFRNKLSRKQA